MDMYDRNPGICHRRGKILLLKNRKSRSVFLLFCLLLFSAFTEQDGVMRRLYITYSGSCSSLSIYIRGRGDDSYRYYGRVRRERTRGIMLPGGRYYIVRLQRGRSCSRKRVYLPMGNDRELIFLAPNLAGITVRLRGRYRWANLIINDRFYGKIFWNRPVQIPLSTVLRHSIRVERAGAVRVRRIRLRRRGPGKHRRVTIFLGRE